MLENFMKLTNKILYEIRTGRSVLKTLFVSSSGAETKKLSRGVSQEIYRNHLGCIKIPVVEIKIINGKEVKTTRTIIREYKLPLR